MSQCQPLRPGLPAVLRQGSDAAAAQQEALMVSGNRCLEIVNQAQDERRRRVSESLIHDTSNPIFRHIQQCRQQRQRRLTMTVINETSVYSVEPFDIRPALLETDARNNVGSYDRWCAANSIAPQC
ncbi:hypothetical protein PBRA_009202 [Plasmodiophora brassicae]|uniref:Uncharacterized protein n=1 Tax=Plasmodiophora brassicae TaxID=37360 RepID=A0A0G4J6G1_PLABS|nr:hypothetical protein PBRA_009202 [Plasmodiophora brassicae]